MKVHSVSRRTLTIFAAVWIILLACRVTDGLVAQGGTPATATPTTRPRPTFTLAARLLETPTDIPPPPSPTRPPPPTPRPPTRVPPTVKPAATAPPPPTPDPDAGYYYKRIFKGCAVAPNTRIEGTVTENGTLRNGVRVRISFEENGPPDTPLADFVTGVDPSDPNHIPCPSCEGKYRLSPAEGGRIDGNWWVFVVDGSGNPMSKSTFIHTQDGPGCNTATLDFAH